MAGEGISVILDKYFGSAYPRCFNINAPGMHSQIYNVARLDD
jgi:hypothetical protein